MLFLIFLILKGAFPFYNTFEPRKNVTANNDRLSFGEEEYKFGSNYLIRNKSCRRQAAIPAAFDLGHGTLSGNSVFEIKMRIHIWQRNMHRSEWCRNDL